MRILISLLFSLALAAQPYRLTHPLSNGVDSSRLTGRSSAVALWNLTNANTIPNSEALNLWTATAVTRTSGQLDPIGGSNAWLIAATSSDSDIIGIGTLTNGAVGTCAMWLKSGSAGNTSLSLFIHGATYQSKALTVIPAWAFYSFTFMADAATTSCWIGGGSTFSTGESVYAWHPQLNSGPLPLPYVATDAMTTAADISGHGNTLTKAAGAAAPTSLATGWNFASASSQYATSPALSGVSLPGGWTVQQVGLFNGLSTSGRVVVFGSSNTNTALIRGNDATSAMPGSNDGTMLTSGAIAISNTVPAMLVLKNLTSVVSLTNVSSGAYNSIAARPGLSGTPSIVVSCTFGGSNCMGAVNSLIAAYSAALSAPQVAHNYRASKAILAPFGVALP